MARSYLDELFGNDRRLRDHVLDAAVYVEDMPGRDELRVTFDTSKPAPTLPLTNPDDVVDAEITDDEWSK